MNEEPQYGLIAMAVKEYFSRKGITITAAAGRLGMSQQSLSQLLSGRKISFRTADLLSREFKFNREFLLTGQGVLTNDFQEIAAADDPDDDRIGNVNLNDPQVLQYELRKSRTLNVRYAKQLAQAQEENARYIRENEQLRALVEKLKFGVSFDDCEMETEPVPSVPGSN